MLNKVYEFDLEAGMWIDAETDFEISAPEVVEDWFDEWSWQVADGVDATLHYGSLDENCMAIDPKIDFYQSSPSVGKFKLGEKQYLETGSTIQFSGFANKEGKQVVVFRYYLNLRFGIQASSILEAKQIARAHTKTSFFLNRFQDNDEIEFLTVTSVTDNDTVIDDQDPNAICEKCLYLKATATSVCSHCAS